MLRVIFVCEYLIPAVVLQALRRECGPFAAPLGWTWSRMACRSAASMASLCSSETSPVGLFGKSAMTSGVLNQLPVIVALIGMGVTP